MVILNPKLDEKVFGEGKEERKENLLLDSDVNSRGVNTIWGRRKRRKRKKKKILTASTATYLIFRHYNIFWHNKYPSILSLFLPSCSYPLLPKFD